MTSDDRTAGEVFAERFRLERRLGAGTSSSVWEVVELATQRVLALKLLDPRYGDRVLSVQRFLREGEVLAALDHPHLARPFEAGIVSGQPYLLMELAIGVPLDGLFNDRAKLGRGFSQLELTSLISQIADAIGHAHARGILHRDLKPANVLVAQLGGGELFVKVVDFGLAKFFDEERGSEGTTRGRRLGTLAYMAPEQARGELVGPRADIFSLGVIAFELLTMQHAYHDPAALLERMANGPRLKATDHVAVDPRFDAVLERAMAGALADRYESIASFASDFVALCAPPPRRPRAPYALIAASMIVLASALILPRMRMTTDPIEPLARPPQPRVAQKEPDPDPVPVPAPVPVPESTAKKNRPAPAPIQTVRSNEAAPRPDRDRALLRDLENGSTAISWIDLGEKIAQRASAIGDEKERARVQRLARSSAALADAAGLDRALDALDAVEHAEDAR